jgi:hypothetical protein
MQGAPKLCGARTRSGAPCRTPVVGDRSRCRMHGGTSPGAPKGNKNAWKHGRYSAQAIGERRRAGQVVRQLAVLIEALANSGRE